MRYASPGEALLAAHLATNRMAHTYLFSGPSSPSKNELVLGFAKALNCEDDCRALELVGATRRVAPTCASCLKIEKRTHPDVQWFEEDKKTGAVKIEEVRLRLHQASLKPFEGKWKVFIMDHAENLTLDASHALLKTLEEPPEHSVFLLLVENKAHLLETIQSRSVEIRVAPPPEKDVREDAKIQLLEEKGWDAFFADLGSTPRANLLEGLGILLHYLRDSAAREWQASREHSRRYLDAIDSVCETQKALDANANQKLALTHLEIRLRRCGLYG